MYNGELLISEDFGFKTNLTDATESTPSLGPIFLTTKKV